MEASQEKRVAIVTGASRGIGRAIAERLAADGHHVVAVARSTEALDAFVVAAGEAGGSAEAKTCDIGDGAALAAVIEGVHDERGRLDILVNNAGITRDGLILRMSDEDFDDVINVNLRAAFVACRAAARPMMRGRFGRMLNVGSVSGINGNAGQVNYAASKAALIGMTKSIAKELGPKGVTANVIAPGLIATDMTGKLGDALLNELTTKIPLRRVGAPEEIASVASWLASDEASYVTGQVIVVDGGLAM